ncbi:MAG: hypothetical protein M1834_007002 [Cirrosporium novae-zelandiae]|nr:MAG: hypothetical protein M1834_007002 [Cirrosporium novae-zelandiae]
MAFETPCLLATILSLAATHRKVAGLDQSDNQLAHLRSTSLKQFRMALSKLEGAPGDAIMATALTLCLSEIVAGGNKPDSWRLHLEGAATLFSQAFDSGCVKPGAANESKSSAFIWRWFISFVALTNFCGKPSLSSGSRIALRFVRMVQDNYIDDFTGYSTKLIPIFAEIGLLVMERQSSETVINAGVSHISHTAGISDLMRERCNRLIEEIQSMIHTDTGKFREGLEEIISPKFRCDYIALNQAYHHAALLHLYHRVLELPSSSQVIQTSVKQIITCISAMALLREPCPGIALLLPLFSAGCEVIDIVDRTRVTELLGVMDQYYNVRNVRRSMEFLQDLWMHRDIEGDLYGYLRWDKLLGLYLPLCRTNKPCNGPLRSMAN